MRASAAAPSTGPASLRIMRSIGESGSEASAMPISAPIDVPNQWTVGASRRASNVTMSPTYVGNWYSIGSRRRPLRPRPTTSGHPTR